MPTPALVQSFGNYNTPAGSTSSKTVSATVTTGNAILIFVSAQGNITFSATDSASNTYTAKTAVYNAALTFGLQGLYALNVTGGSLTITITSSAAADKWRIWCHEVSNLGTFDGANQTASSGNANSGTITPTATGDFLLGCAVNNAGTVGAQGAGWTAGFTAGSEDTEYRVYASTSAIAATYTNDGSDYVAAIMAFTASGAAPAATNHWLTLLGCGQ